MRPPRNSNELNGAQCEQLERRIFECLRFLRKLLNRIEQLHFPADDPLRADVQAAYDRVFRLRIAVHYMACDRLRREGSPTGNYELARRKRQP